MKKVRIVLTFGIIIKVELPTTVTFNCIYCYAVLHSLDIRPYTFSYSELRGATQDFNPSNKLGEGGFGPVFKVAPLADNGCNFSIDYIF